MRTLLFSFLVFLAIPARASVPHLPTTGFLAYDEQKVREVVCIDRPEFTAAQCAALVLPAMAMVNEALGWEHYVFRGFITDNGAKAAYEQGIYLVAGSTKMSKGRLGLTVHGSQSGSIKVVQTVLNTKEMAQLTQTANIAALAHEFLHGLGLAHADCQFGPASIMAPDLGCPKFAFVPSAEDVAMLRAYFPP